MKFERFDYLKEGRLSDYDMGQIFLYDVFPQFQLDVSDQEFCHKYGIRYIGANNLWNFPTWEIYLNGLMQETGISKEALEDIVRTAIQASENAYIGALKKLFNDINEKNA